MELLSPAGAPEALIAAINNGADAVYLGLDDLNARRGAANFDLASLAEATRFAHLRGGRVYLTANVVVLQAEMEPALRMVESAWAAGVDAVIVQDLGLMRAIRLALPEVRIHASTQIDAMNPDSIVALSVAGASRVTLARELSLEAIAACAATGVEIETFVHGALCYCYSGQCLMSSLIGRRSANRGLCAQPCRLTYDLIDRGGTAVTAPGRYLLSPKDLAGIEHLPGLVAAGVGALKIEGRMKAPEYVAIVTGVYRAALDRAVADPESFEVLPAEREMLEEAFNRGFTDGYLTGKRGVDLMSYTRPNNRGVLIGRVAEAGPGRAGVQLERALDSADTLELWTRIGRFAQQAGTLTVGGSSVSVAPAGTTVNIVVEEPVAVGDRVFRVANATLLQAARRTFSGASAIDHRATTVDFEVRVRVGETLLIAAVARGVRVQVEGPEVAVARTKAISADEIVEHVGRLGGSGYRAGAWRIDLDANAGLGFSELHSLRRSALEQLDSAGLQRWAGRQRVEVTVPAVGGCSVKSSEPLVVATAWSLQVAEACLAAGADRALLRVFGPPDTDAASVLPDGVSPLLPRVMWPAEVPGYDAWLEQASPTCGNLGSLKRASARGDAGADWPLNALNPHTAAALGDFGATFLWASPELSGRQLAELCAASVLPIGCVVWGRLELMISEQCVLQVAGACSRACDTCERRRSWWRLRDGKGYEFPVTTDRSGRSHIMNSVTLDLTRALDEVVAAGVGAVRLDFADESPERAADVVGAVRSTLTAVAGGARPPDEPLVKPATSGHFYRGVL